MGREPQAEEYFKNFTFHCFYVGRCDGSSTCSYSQYLYFKHFHLSLNIFKSHAVATTYSKVPYYLVLNHVFIPQLAMASNPATVAIPAKCQCEIVAIPNVSYMKRAIVAICRKFLSLF